MKSVDFKVVVNNDGLGLSFQAAKLKRCGFGNSCLENELQPPRCNVHENPASRSATGPSATQRVGMVPAQGSNLRMAVVYGISFRGCEAEVVSRIGGEQWIVATVDADLIKAWDLRIGRTVFVDPTARPISLQPEKIRCPA